MAAIARRTELAEIQTIGEENALLAVRLSKITVLPAEWSRLTESAPTAFGVGAIPADWLAARVLSRPADVSDKPEPAFDVTFDGAAVDPLRGGNQVLGFSAHGEIDRVQWGVNEWSAFTGDTVQIVIEAEFVKA